MEKEVQWQDTVVTAIRVLSDHLRKEPCWDIEAGSEPGTYCVAVLGLRIKAVFLPQPFKC